MEHTKNAIKKNGTIQDGRDDKQKTILLRIPNVVEPDQLVNAHLEKNLERSLLIEYHNLESMCVNWFPELADCCPSSVSRYVQRIRYPAHTAANATADSR